MSLPFLVLLVLTAAWLPASFEAAPGLRPGPDATAVLLHPNAGLVETRVGGQNLPSENLRPAESEITRTSHRAYPFGAGIQASGPPVAPSRGAFGGVVGRTAEESAFLDNAAATFREGSVYTSAKRYWGEIVIQRSDIPLSVQNVRRMAGGHSPFVRNASGEWEAINLHHVGRQEGKLIEVLQNQNAYNPTTGGPLHIPGPGGPVRTPGFTNGYWMQRLQDYIDAGSVPRTILEQVGR